VGPRRGQLIARKAEEAVAQARAQAEAERQARAAAEDRAKMEAVARVMQEQELRSGAEDEIKSRVQAEIKAREHAEVEAEARYRQESAARAKAAAEERKRRPTQPGKPVPRFTRPPNRVRTIGIISGVVLAIAIGLLHVVPLNHYIGGAQQVMAQRLGVPVTITNLRYALLPFPRLTLERVGIGKLQEIKIESIVVSAWPMTLFGDSLDFDNVEINSLNTDQETLSLIPGWTRPQAGAQRLSVRRVQLKSVRLAVKDLNIPNFNGDITLSREGALQRAVLTDGKARIEIAPKDNGLSVGLEAHNWRLPIGPAVEFEDLVAEAVMDSQQARITAIDGKIGRATIKGGARANWGGGIRVEGSFTVTNGDLAQLLSSFTRDFSATGTLQANVSYALQGTTLQNLFAEPRVEATFNIEKGVLNNVDIVRAIQIPARDGVRGGKTGFNSLAGSMRLANQSYSYHQLQLSSGPMNSFGSVDIAPNGNLSGRISTQLGSKNVIVARQSERNGQLKTPALRRWRVTRCSLLVIRPVTRNEKRQRKKPARAGFLLNRYATGPLRAAMRSSSGGCDMNNRVNPPPPEIPKAEICAGSRDCSWLSFNRSSAAIIFPRPASVAPPASARNSRQRENHITTMLARMPSTICATMTVM
jgi:hypothetical protein